MYTEVFCLLMFIFWALKELPLANLSCPQHQSHTIHVCIDIFRQSGSTLYIYIFKYMYIKTNAFLFHDQLACFFLSRIIHLCFPQHLESFFLRSLIVIILPSTYNLNHFIVFQSNTHFIKRCQSFSQIVLRLVFWRLFSGNCNGCFCDVRHLILYVMCDMVALFMVAHVMQVLLIMSWSQMW